jgi:hypothetical protein
MHPGHIATVLLHHNGTRTKSPHKLSIRHAEIPHVTLSRRIHGSQPRAGRHDKQRPLTCFGVAAHHSAAVVVTVDSELEGSGQAEVGYDSRSATKLQQAQVLLVDILSRH